MEVVAVVGAVTAFFAATIAMVQTDIKRVLAYSTISQLGYMFLGVGVGRVRRRHLSPDDPRFFKGLLFLCAGSVIHALDGEQDMSRMGALWRQDADHLRHDARGDARDKRGAAAFRVTSPRTSSWTARLPRAFAGSG